MTCTVDGEIFNGTFMDGYTYYDGVAAMNGWIYINGVKTYYYKDGVMLTGSHYIDDVMHTFDDKGKYLPDSKYNGWYDINDTKMYFVNNEFITGLNRLNLTDSGEFDYYNFDKNGYAYDGVYNIGGYDCTFDNGLIIPDNIVALAGICGDNVEYVILKNGKMILDGEGPTYDFITSGLIPWYNTNMRNLVSSIFVGKDITSIGTRMFYYFANVRTITFEEGSKVKVIKPYAMSLMVSLRELVLPESVQSIHGLAFYKTYYLDQITIPASVTGIANTAFKEVENVILNVTKGSYAHTFAVNMGLNYKIVTSGQDVKQGLVKDSDGKLRYYENGVAQYAGLVEGADGNYYYIGGNKEAKVDCYYVISKTNGLLPVAGYWFDKDGKLCYNDPSLKQGLIKDSDGKLRYYIDGVAQYAGLVKGADGYYYYIGGNKEAKVNCSYAISKTNDLLPVGVYWFDAEGRLIIK